MENKHIVKIFISSTFREMKNERDAIQQIVFVKIRFWARRLGVLVIPIDLRWGITDEDIKKGKLAFQCNEAIKICFPFFIGILGNTYGTDTKSVLGYVEKKYYGKSVTDFEITKGVLETNNSKAIVYNITYSDKKENILKKYKLNRLKKEISNQGLLIDVNIKERLVSNMIIDIKNLLETSFSCTHGDDLLSKELFNTKSCFYSQYYNTFFSKKYFEKYIYLPNERLYLVKAVENESVHFFLYNMAFILEKEENLSIIYHDCKLSSYDKTCEGILKHIIEKIYKDKNKYFFSCGNLYEDFLATINQLNNVNLKYIVFIDSLKNIDKKEADKTINFLLEIKKAGINFICADFNGSYFFQDRVQEINVLPLTKEEAYQYVSNFLHEYKKDNNKKLTDEIIEHMLKLNNYDLSFIQLILNEVLLRGCPSSEIISEIDKLTNETSSLNVVKKIIQRIIESVKYKKELQEITKIVLVSLSLAEEYLTIGDICNIVMNLKNNTYYVTESLEMLNELLSVNGEKYSYRFEIVNKAVQELFFEYINHIDTTGIYKYFSNAPLSIHNSIELIGYLRRHKDIQTIINYVLSDNIFEMFYIENMSELYRLLNMDIEYTSNRIENIVYDSLNIINQKNKLLVDYAINCCNYKTAYNIISFLINNSDDSCWMIKKGYLERENGNYLDAIATFEEALTNPSISQDDRLKVYDYLSYCYGKTNSRENSIKYANYAIDIRKSDIQKYEFDMPVSLNSLAYNYYRKNCCEDAIKLYKESCDIRIKYLGSEHPRVSNNMNNIGKVYLKNGDFLKAYSIFKKSYSNLCKIMGNTHMYSMICRMNCILCELILKISKPEILLTEIIQIRKMLNERMRYNDYIAYADFIYGVLDIVCHKGINTSIMNAREYYQKNFGEESFEVLTIDLFLENNIFEMERLF